MSGDIRYARTSDGLHIAFTVRGEGPALLLAPTMTQPIEWTLEDPASSRFVDRLAEFSRVILFDKRGTGRSDPMLGAPTLEERSVDIEAVLDATMSDSAVLFGVSEGGSMCTLFAATHPERTTALITWGTLIRSAADEDDMDDPFLMPRSIFNQMFTAENETWGDGLDLWNPSVMHDPAHQRSNKRRLQLGASPAMAAAIGRLAAETDIREIVPLVSVPTLVLHRTNDLVPISHGHYLADKIAGARFVELPGRDHYPWIGDMESVIAEVQDFVTGVRPTSSAERVMSAVLFTDLVNSTTIASQIGDHRWRDVLAQHDRLVRDLIKRHRGRYVRSAGDEAIATFDGPTRAVRCAQAILDELPELGLEARAGIHAGEIELVGDGDIAGIGVHIAHRVLDHAGAGDVLVSSTVKELAVGSEIVFVDQGTYELRGVPDSWTLYRAKVG